MDTVHEGLLKRIHYCGHPLIPLHKNSKLPVERGWQKKPKKSWDEIHTHILNGNNVGIRCDHLTVVDFDDIENARKWFLTYKQSITMIVRTRRGAHFYFKCVNESNFVGSFDVRSGSGGYVVGPDSIVNNHVYHCVSSYDNIECLHPFNPDWLPKKKTTPQANTDSQGDMVFRAVKYAEAIPGATEGNRDNTAFQLACKLLQQFKLDTTTAWSILLSYNQRCLPPLSNRQLKQKLNQALKQA